jgi:hypothetical protein
MRSVGSTRVFLAIACNIGREDFRDESDTDPDPQVAMMARKETLRFQQ